MVWLSRTVDVVHRSPRFVMLIVLHCLNLKQQIDLSLYDLISITFLMNSLLDLYVQDVLSLLSLGINTSSQSNIDQSISQSNFQFN